MIVGELVDAGHAEIRTGPFGTQLKAADYVDEGRAVLNVRNVGFGEVRPDKLEFVDEETASRLSGHILEAGDIVFGRKGAVERHAYIRSQYAGSLQGSDCIRLRIFDGAPIVHAFATFALRTVRHQAWMQSFCSHGATMASLNQDILRQVELPDLDLSAQSRVVEVLQSIDDLIENNRRRVVLLEEMARAIYREWFVHLRFPGHEDASFVDSPLGRIPEGWKAVELQTIADLVRGRSYRKHELVEEGGLPFINLKCMMRGGGFRRDGLKRYSGEFKDGQLTRSGDIVLAVTDLTQGREILARATLVPRLSEPEGVISLDVARIVPKNPEDRLWIFAALRWGGFSERVKEYANGSTVLHLSPSHVSSGLVLCSDHASRERFVGALTPSQTMIDELDESASRLSDIRDILLPKLVSGQIDVSTLDLDKLIESAAAH